MPHLYLPASGLQFTFEELKLLPKATELSDYEKAIVQFCYHWLNQQQAFTVYTSGSTGNPKPISIKRKQMQLSAELTVKALHIKSNEHVFSCLHVRHIAGKMMLVRGLEFNLPITAVEPAANPLQQFHANHPFEFASFVPLQVQSILEQADGASKLNRFKHILVGGAPITSYQEQLFQSLEVPIFHTYGMSETVSHIALRRVNGEKKSDQFKTLDHVEIALDERKCLSIKSPVTDYTTIKTNDIVELHGKHHFKWLGRYDWVINMAGNKILVEPLELEVGKWIEEIRPNSLYAISSKSDPKLNEKLVLCIEGDPWLAKEIQQLHSNLQSLEKPTQPKELVFIAAIPKTTTHKTDRLKLKDMLENVDPMVLK